MKRNQRTAGVSGCPECHKTASRTDVVALRSVPKQTRSTYVCNTPSCNVVRFTVDRLAE